MNGCFTDEEKKRYHRHFTLPQVGQEGQKKLKSAKVLCIGAGGLGSCLLLNLAAAGVGTIGIIDPDIVELSNLQRQILYTTEDIGLSKVHAAKARLMALNPNIQIIAHEDRLTRQNMLMFLKDYDIIADGTDNFSARYGINDACYFLNKPNVHASIFQFEGQCTIFTAEGGPCYRCLYAEPPPPAMIPSCAEGGVLGILPNLMGTLQAAEIIKWILDIGEPLAGRLLKVDVLSLQFQELQLRKNPDCRLCGKSEPLEAFSEDAPSCVSTPDRITQKALRQLTASGKHFILLDVREPQEYEQCNLGGRLIPLHTLPEQCQTLDKNQHYVIHCHSGIRSLQAVQYLKAAGFPHVQSLDGGIAAWRFDEPDENKFTEKNA